MKRRFLIIGGVVVVILGGAITAAELAPRLAAKQPTANTSLPPATAEVTRTTLVETKTVPGTLGHGNPVAISATGSGTLTWIAPVGSTAQQGDPLFKVDERPVVDLYGSLPLYRMLGVGTKGSDVQQLKKNLAELGYTGFTVDDSYNAATAAAVRTWQAKLGLPATGTVEPGQMVVTPGPVLIAEHTARVGDTTGGGSAERGGSVLSYTGTTTLVTVDLKVTDQALAAQGRTVTVTVPGGKAVQGTISEVGTVAKAPENASAAPGSTSSTSSAAADARIQVTVTIADQGALGSLNTAPVDVDLVSAERKGVLAVPVAALLALTDGGYGVEIVSGNTTRIVTVKTGMFADGRVEVSGEGIAEGVTVGVAK